MPPIYNKVYNVCGQTTYKMHYKLTAFCQRIPQLLMPIHQLAFRPEHLATLCYEIVFGPIAMLIEVAIPLMHLILFAFRPQRNTHIYRIWVARFAYIIRQLPLIVILKLVICSVTIRIYTLHHCLSALCIVGVNKTLIHLSR